MRAAFVSLLLSWSAYSQCVMCNRTAAAQQMERAKVLDLGIVFLFVPPFVILGGLVWLAAHRRHKE